MRHTGEVLPRGASWNAGGWRDPRLAAEAAVVTSASLGRGHWIVRRRSSRAWRSMLGLASATRRSTPRCALWRLMLGIRRCARRSGEAVPRGVRNALLMRAGFLAGTRGRLAPRLHGAGPIRLRPHLGWMIHVRGRVSGAEARVTSRSYPFREPVPSGHRATPSRGELHRSLGTPVCVGETEAA